MDEVERLISELKSPDEKVSVDTIGALIKYREYERTVPAFIDALKSEFSEVRKRAAIYLGQIGDKSAVPALIEALKDENPSVRANSATALKYLNHTSAVPALIGTLKDPDLDVRRDSAIALGHILDASLPCSQERIQQSESLRSSVVPALIERLKTDHVVVRDHSAEALGLIGHPSAIPALIEALMDMYSRVRSIAQDALTYILGLSNTLELLKQCEEKIDEGFTNVKKRYRNKEAYRKIGTLITEQKIEIAKKKNELAVDKGILLSNIPKPPKGGQVYQSLRRVRNG